MKATWRACVVVGAMATVLAPAAVVASQPTPGGRVDIRDVVSEAPPAVQVLLRVYDGAGLEVGGLRPETFSVFEDDQLVQNVDVRASHPEEGPLTVSLLIDTSGSMREDQMRGAIDGAKTFLGTLTPEDQVEVYGFGREAEQPVLQFGEARDPARIDALTPGGDTPMRDAIVAAVGRLAQQPSPNRAIILLTDGEDDGSLNPPEAVLDALTANGVKLYGLALGGVDTAELVQLTASQPGRVATVTDASQLNSVYRDMSAGLASEYRLAWESTAGVGDHTIAVHVMAPGVDAQATRSFTLGGGPEIPPEPESSSAGIVIAVVAGVAALGALLAVLLLRRKPALATVGGARPSAPAPFTPTPPPPGPASPFALAGANGTFPLIGSGIVVGRDPRAHIVIDDGTVSRTHARFDIDPNGVWIEDLGSANGTKVNGAPAGRELLNVGDVISLGDHTLTLVRSA